jgi:large subunit ribosomal protein L29
MQAKELRELSVEELVKRGNDLRKERVLMRIQQDTGNLENPSRFRVVKKDIARIETVLTERRQKAATSKA